MNRIKKYKLFLESKNIEKELEFEDDYSNFHIDYIILDDEGDEIEVSYTGYYVEKDDEEGFENNVLDLGENEIKDFVEESIEEDVRKYLNFKFIKFIYN